MYYLTINFLFKKGKISIEISVIVIKCYKYDMYVYRMFIIMKSVCIISHIFVYFKNCQNLHYERYLNRRS